MHFISLLLAPVSYMEQIKYDFKQTDEYGMTVLHYAALKLDFSWLTDAIFIDKENIVNTLSVNTESSDVLQQHIPHLGKRDNINYNKLSIPFGEGGYSVPHLLVFMMSYFSLMSHIDKEKRISEIEGFIKNILTININILTIKDANNLSVFEYILLLGQSHILIDFKSQISSDFCTFLSDETLCKLNEKYIKNINLNAELISFNNYINNFIIAERAEYKIKNALEKVPCNCESSSQYNMELLKL